jgi:hypothetical protein
MTVLIRLRTAFVVFVASLRDAFSDRDHTSAEKSTARLAAA